MPPLLFPRNIEGNTLMFLEGLDEEIVIYLVPDPREKKLADGVDKEVRDFIVEIGVDLDKNPAILEADFDRFVDDFHRGSHVH